MAAGRANSNAPSAKARARSASPRARRRKPPSCEDCFFRRRGLCALGLDEPCPTFRPDTPRGLVPPVQPALLSRDPVEAEALETAA